MWTAVGTLAALLTSFGFLPQVLKMWKRRSVGDVSLATFVQFTLGVVLWTVYGLYIKDVVVVVANLVTLVILIAGLLSYYRFRPSAAGGVIRGAVLGATQAGTDPMIAVHEAAKGLIKGADAGNGNVAVLARAAIREAADSAKAREVHLPPETLARAAADGALEGAREVDATAASGVRAVVDRALAALREDRPA
jgi:MtN3 and saliva related transmembrane protein